jgi:VWFA-related protein
MASGLSGVGPAVELQHQHVNSYPRPHRGGYMMNPYVKPRNARRFFGTLLAVAFLTCGLWGVQPGAQAPPPQTGGVTFRVDVELTTVEVMVRDKKGDPVKNLTKDDLQLFEDGKRQDIVTFVEISDDQDKEIPTSLADIDDSTATRGKIVLIFFDDSHLTSPQVQVARQSAEKYVKAHMRPFDLFAVATYGRALKILQNYTHDATKVLEAIRQPAVSYAQSPVSSPADSGMPQTSGRGAPRGSPGIMEGADSRFQISSLFRALNSLSSSIGMVKGRKAILFFSEDFSSNSDIQAEFQNMLNAARKGNVAFYTIDAKPFGVPTIGGGAAGLSEPAESLPAKASKASPTQRAGTAYTISKSLAGFGAPINVLTAVRSMFQQGQGQGTGQRGGGTGTGSTGGTTRPGGSGGTGAGSAGAGEGSSGGAGNSRTGANPSPTSGTPRDPNSDSSMDNSRNNGFPQFALPSMSHMLRALAAETGGTAILSTNDYTARLDDVDRELSNYYVLGFQSNNPRRDGRFRQIEVKTASKVAEVRHRTGYVDPRPLDLLVGTKGEKSMMNAMASPTAAAQLPVTFRTHYFYESPELARIPLVAKIRSSAIELRKKGDQVGSDVSVMGVAYAENGSVAARFSDTLNVLIDKDQQEAFKAQDLPYHNHFKLRPGTYQVKLVVADERGKVGSAVQALVVPPMPQGNLAASSLVVAERAGHLPELIQDLQARLLDDNDPLTYKGLQIQPSIDQQLRVNAPIAALFSLYNLSSSQQPRQLVAQPRLLDEKGEVIQLAPVQLDKHEIEIGKTEARIAVNFPLKNVAPGKYKLEIVTSEGASSRAVTMQTDLQIK